MARPSRRAALKLSEEDKAMLAGLAGSRTAPRREVERARVMLGYAEGDLPTQIQPSLGLSRPTIYKCIDRALAAGVEAGLKDRFHRPHAPQISDDARAWVVALACCKPKELGYAAEVWTLSALAEHVRGQCARCGEPVRNFVCGA